MRRLLLLAVLLLAAPMVVGCSATPGSTAAVVDPMLVGDAPSPEAADSPSGAAPLVLELGGGEHRFRSGVSISVTAERYEPTGTYPTEPGPFVLLRLTVTNDSDVVVDANPVREVTLDGQPGQAVELVADEALVQNQAQILPGQQQRTDQAVVVPEVGGDLVVRVADPAGLLGTGPTPETVYFRGPV